MGCADPQAPLAALLRVRDDRAAGFCRRTFFPASGTHHESVPTEITPQGAAAVVYLGVLVTVGAYGLFNFGISRLPANQASAFVNPDSLFTCSSPSSCWAKR